MDAPVAGAPSSVPALALRYCKNHDLVIVVLFDHIDLYIEQSRLYVIKVKLF